MVILDITCSNYIYIYVYIYIVLKNINKDAKSYLAFDQNYLLEHSVDTPFKTDLKILILVFTSSYRITPYVRENVHNQRRRTLKNVK